MQGARPTLRHPGRQPRWRPQSPATMGRDSRLAHAMPASAITLGFPEFIPFSAEIWVGEKRRITERLAVAAEAFRVDGLDVTAVLHESFATQPVLENIAAEKADLLVVGARSNRLATHPARQPRGPPGATRTLPGADGASERTGLENRPTRGGALRCDTGRVALILRPSHDRPARGGALRCEGGECRRGRGCRRDHRRHLAAHRAVKKPAHRCRGSAAASCLPKGICWKSTNAFRSICSGFPVVGPERKAGGD